MLPCVAGEQVKNVLDAALDTGRGLVFGGHSADGDDDDDDAGVTQRLGDAALVASSVLAANGGPDEVGGRLCKSPMRCN